MWFGLCSGGRCLPRVVPPASHLPRDVLRASRPHSRQAREAVKKSLNKQKYLARRRKGAKSEKKTKQLFVPNLCASASLREIVNFFTRSDACGTAVEKRDQVPALRHFEPLAGSAHTSVTVWNRCGASGGDIRVSLAAPISTSAAT